MKRVQKQFGLRLGSASLALLALLSAPGCVAQSRYDNLVTQYNAELQQRRQLEDESGRHQSQVDNLSAELASKDEAYSQLASASQADKARIEELMAAVDAAQKAFPTGDTSDGVEIFRTIGGIAYRIADQLLFASGSTEIRDAGKKALLKIAKEINDKGYKNVRVDGHTDSDPVVRTLGKYPLGNQELAIERALSVYSVLTKEGKVPDAAFTIVGFGPNAPVEKQSTTDAAKAKNRRVEIHIAIPPKN
ncbi:MAG: hypothetical protein EXS13_03085 [Planctomycetes bacterium]|nr:hypothetical protein [Planctomycetota bacterium]